MKLSLRPWSATYRLQLHAGFTFDDVASIAPYLAALGVSDVYLSPIVQAAPGSLHGYDATDPTKVSNDLGGRAAYERASNILRDHGIGQIVDIVPNHMAASQENPWWWDVLKRGPGSDYASYFDLRWQAGGERPYIRLPVLGSETEAAVFSGDLHLRATPRGSVFAYFDSIFPVAPETEPGATLIDAVINDPKATLALLEEQHYRLVPWRTAATVIDYRRFFDVNGLAGLRVEDAGVFEATHGLILDQVARGRIQGLRIDHVDGLRDPEAYLMRLRQAAPDARIVVEKILGAGEELPRSWPADGTTGYEFLGALNGLFVDPRSETSLTELYREITGEFATYPRVLAESKRYVLQQLFGGDLTHLVTLFSRAVPGNDWDAAEIATVLREVIVALPVYRTYVQPARNELTDADRATLETGLREAVDALAGVTPAIVRTLRSLLLLERTGEAEAEFVLAFQQLSGPAMAKGAEDTAFYAYNRLVSLNEVGGNPWRFGTTPDEFHDVCFHNAELWPLTMLSTSTHDTKRGEDVRLRIDAISELPDDWSDLIRDWMRRHDPFLKDGAPDTNTRYLLYQTLAGAWPLDFERTWRFMLKAIREAKTHSSWLHADETFERATHDYIARVFRDLIFLDECEAFVARLDRIARISSLSQTLLKLTAPGVPDIYQGAELWDLRLVDPDNRSPVDYEARRELLEEAKGLSTPELLARMDEGLPKLWLIWKTLGLRNERPDLFSGDYTPLFATGPHHESILAFMRRGQLIAVVPRLIERVEADKGATQLPLPPGWWRNVFSDGAVPGGDAPVEELLRHFPVALLVREDVA